MPGKQAYSFAFEDSAIAEAGGVPLDALHRDADAICRSYDSIVPVAERLGVPPPRPRLGGFEYNHVSALGARLLFPNGSEPNVEPIIHDPDDIDGLQEPDDYLSSGVIPQRIRLYEELRARRPDAVPFIGGTSEGALTTATLLMGQDFLMLPYEDPERAHRLLAFCVRSSINYKKAVWAYLERPEGSRPVGLCDDFGGMFPPDMFAEFVVPYWEWEYEGLEAVSRSLHSELLRKEHLPFLTGLKVSIFDPAADQYVTPELLREHCPVPFTARILTWDVRDNSPLGLQQLYRQYAACRPTRIDFSMASLEYEQKMLSLLEVARELAGDEMP